MDTQPPKRLRKEDFRIDWKHYPINDENGNPTTADFTEKREEWLIWDCECGEDCLADQEACYLYYKIDYDPEKFKQWMEQNNYRKSDIAWWGLQRMFNDGWIKSPTFVDWRDIFLFFNDDIIKRFVEAIFKLDTRIDILKHFISNAEFLFGKNRKKELLPGIKNLLNIQQEALKLHNEELKRKAAAEKAKNKKPKEKPEYILSVDEIIHYAKSNPDAAVAISGMLRYYAFEKEAWFNKTIRDKINEIEKHLLLIQTEKVSFEDKVENVKITERK